MSSIEINHHYPNSDPDIARRLGRIEKAQTQLIEKVDRIMANLTELRREMSELAAALAALVERLQNSPDQAEIDAIVVELDTIGKQIEALVPAAPTP